MRPFAQTSAACAPIEPARHRCEYRRLDATLASSETEWHFAEPPLSIPKAAFASENSITASLAEGSSGRDLAIWRIPEQRGAAPTQRATQSGSNVRSVLN